MNGKACRLFGLALFALFAFLLLNPTPTAAANPPPIRTARERVPFILRRVPGNGKPVHIPPLYQPGVRPATATFSITYKPAGSQDPWGADCGAWSTAAKTAFTAAANVWATLIDSDVPIRIEACWSNLGSPYILGYSGSNITINSTGAVPDTWYSYALADALAGQDQDENNPDFYITYNTGFSWYFGTDGNTPWNQMDFMSVVMHEMGHGLNFAGSMDVSGTGRGSWGYGGDPAYPDIYDRFVENGPGQALINSFANDSAALAAQLQGNNLYFNGPNATAANSGAHPKIYAPDTWEPGSSYSHFDYDTFNDTPNELMVYAISDGESVHSPGPVGLALLKDIGWAVKEKTTSTLTVDPNPIALGQTVTLTATVSPTPNGGTVAFKDGSSNIAGCAAQGLTDNQAVCTTASLTAGAHSVKAVYSGNDDYGTSTSNTVTLTVVGPPAAFAKKSPSDGMNNVFSTVTLAWTASTGATSYEYCYYTTDPTVCDGPWNGPVTGTSVNVSGLAFDTTYHWQVRAGNVAGTTNADGGAWWQFRTAPQVLNDEIEGAALLDPIPFTVSQSTTFSTAATDDPTFACLVGKGYGSVWYQYSPTVNGNLSVNTTRSSYDTILAVWKGTRGSLVNVACSDNYGTVKTSLLAARLIKGVTYYIEIADKAPKMSVSGRTLNLAVNFVPKPPAAVRLVSPATASFSSVPTRVLGWTDSPGADNYQLEARKGTASSPIVISETPTSSTFTTGDLAAGIYYWRVRACNTVGCSVWTPLWYFKVLAPAVPKLLTPINASGILGPDVTLDWNSPANATYYRVMVRQDTTAGTIIFDQQPTDSTFIATGLQSGHWYYWHTRACSPAGCSAWTAWWRFKVR